MRESDTKLPKGQGQGQGTYVQVFAIVLETLESTTVFEHSVCLSGFVVDIEIFSFDLLV